MNHHDNYPELASDNQRIRQSTTAQRTYAEEPCEPADFCPPSVHGLLEVLSRQIDRIRKARELFTERADALFGPQITNDSMVASGQGIEKGPPRDPSIIELADALRVEVTRLERQLNRF